MNIFEALGIDILVAVLIMAIVALVYTCTENDSTLTVGIWLFIISIIITPVIMIAVGTTNEQAYIHKYMAQKETIESALSTESLSGFERVELVNKAVDLNGEFAERKYEYGRWFNVYFDTNMYDNVELIDLEKEKTDE